MILPISLTIAAAAAVINLWLALRIVPTRMRDKGGLPEADAARLTTNMRAHANFAEYAPFILILMALIELAGGSPTGLWIAGTVFVAARVAHGIGMTRPSPNPFRGGGAFVTWAILAALAGWAVATAYHAGAGQPRGIITVESTARG